MHAHEKIQSSSPISHRSSIWTSSWPSSPQRVTSSSSMKVEYSKLLPHFPILITLSNSFIFPRCTRILRRAVCASGSFRNFKKNLHNLQRDLFDDIAGTWTWPCDSWVFVSPSLLIINLFSFLLPFSSDPFLIEWFFFLTLFSRIIFMFFSPVFSPDLLHFPGKVDHYHARFRRNLQ